MLIDLCVTGRFRRSDGNPKAGQKVAVGRHHILGYRVRRAQSAGRVHENIAVQRLDQSNIAILTAHGRGIRQQRTTTRG